MGTIINGNKWSGACVNGNIVSGLVKNGVVFYKKMQSIYKRRIMEGDNLNGKIIYFDFPNNYNLNRDTTAVSFFVMCNSNFLLYDRVVDEKTYVKIEGTYSFDTIYDPDQDINLKEYHINENIPVSLNVSSVTECESYRHCYIEDLNIRPLQVGDKIVKGTKLYFNFPDNLTNVEDKTIFSLDTMEDLYLRISSNEIYITDRLEMPSESPVSTLSIEPTEEGFLVAKDIFNTKDSLNIINLSTYTYECYGYQEGIPVNEIDNELINYVLVDVTTLGNDYTFIENIDFTSKTLDTGLIINSDDYIYFDFTPLSSSTYNNFLSCGATDSKMVRLRAEGSGLMAKIGWYNQKIYNIINNTRINIKIDKQKVYLNEEMKVDMTGVPKFTCDGNLKIGGVDMLFYRLQVKKENILIADYIPALKGETIGLYEQINKKFYEL